jgi:hypothetical protein
MLSTGIYAAKHLSLLHHFLHRLYRSSDATVVIAVQAIQVIISAEQGISDGKHREGIVEAVLYVERKR